MDKPIISSLLDLDKYKILMMQFVHDLHPDVNVTYTFTNRTKTIPLARYIDLNELNEQIQHIKSLRFTFDELSYLKSQPEYKPEFINFLATAKYDVDFNVSKFQDDIHLNFNGNWDVAIVYETLILSLINEMFGKTILNGMTDNAIRNMKYRGMQKLLGKLDKIREYPGIKFIEFGTRRRSSRQWQYEVTSRCKDYAPDNFIGTSNYWLAKELNLKPVGTVAHELTMVRSALDRGETDITGLKHSNHPIRDTQVNTIKAWIDYYGEELSIILTDTFGTNAFIADITRNKELTSLIKATRHDSGDPIAFGYRMIKHYESFNIDPMTKSIVFSDGLDVNLIIKLYKEFKDKINMSFGWGTNLTQDRGIKPLSIVIKASSANDIETCKLSDNINKAMGSKEIIKKYIEVFKPEQIKQETIY